MSGPDGDSPLGRYALEEDAGDLKQVRLIGLPLRLLLAAREHHDGLMREFRLMALAEDQPRAPVPTRLVELTEVLGRRYASARQRPDQEIDEALDRGEDVIDLSYEVPAGVAQGAAGLEALMAEADTFCAAEQLMSLERPPLLQQFAHWYLEQFVVQVAGEPPTPWDGPRDL